jgi:SAM-dependent methyltransferase
MPLPSKFDNDTYELSRDHVTQFIERTAKQYSQSGKRLLEIGPQERSEVRRNFSDCTIDTFDIVPDYSPTLVGDITRHNANIPDATYDIVTCLEVLEHTVNPFGAMVELKRILKDGGIVMLSAPLNWRIHGPVPDCWRFTEFGWMVLLKDFDILEIDRLETPDRNLFPIKYNLLARCNKAKNVALEDMKFEYLK